MNLYPLHVKLAGVCCIVVGGGRVALRKVKGLLACEARVTIISPAVCAGLAALAKKGKVQYRQQHYRRRDLKDCQFVIAATNDCGVNAQVSKDARQRNIFVNVVDDPQQCSAYLPAVVRAGPIIASLATGGCFPGLSKKMRRELTPLFRDYADTARVLGRLRRRVQQSRLAASYKKRLIRCLLDVRVITAARAGKIRTIADLAAFADVIGSCQLSKSRKE